MMRKFTVVAALMVIIAAPLRADLKYATHSEMKPSSEPAAGVPDPLIVLLAGQLAKQLLPDGSADTDYLISDKGVRTDYVKGGLNGEAEGTVTLLLPTGDFVHLNAKDKTYWKTTAAAMKSMMEATGLQPQVSVKPTDQVEKIAGVSSKRSDIEIKIPLPFPAEMRQQLPPGVPTEIAITVEAWMGSAPYEKYLPAATKLRDFMGAALGLSQAGEPGILMRQIVRGMVLGGQQLETVVTKIGEEAAPAGAFDVPADYKEVPSPFAIKSPTWPNPR